MVLCGGTGDIKEATPEVQGLVDQLKAEICSELGGKEAGLGLKATHFKTQVVAGTNFFVRVKLGEEVAHLRIYKHFSGSLQLAGVKRGVGVDDEIQYFEA